MEAEIHIAGLLVHARKGCAQSVAETLQEYPGIEIHAVSEDGKLIVVCECATGREVLAEVERMRELYDVVDVALVYQHAEPANAMEQEIDDECHPT